jgi:hypothetical protein
MSRAAEMQSTPAPVLRTVSPGGTPVELRAVSRESVLTLEHRWPSREAPDWRPLRIGDLLDLLKPGSGIWSWLEGHGVLWGAWLGRGSHEVASFTTAARGAEPSPKRAKAK